MSRSVPPLRPRELIGRLIDARVDFVVIGGVAANLHGLIYNTIDIDVCTRMQPDNLRRILSAIGDLHPCQRMRPDRAPLPPDLAEVPGLRNFYVETDWGWIDFLGEVSGVGTYDQVVARSVAAEISGKPCRFLELDALIDAKRAAGRGKDLRLLPELEALKRLQDEPPPP